MQTENPLTPARTDLVGADRLQLHNIPAELRDRPKWVAWRSIPDRNRPEKKPRKLPVNPKTGREASSTDPATWGTYEQAVACAQKMRLAGVGIVFDGDGFAGIDLDHCYNHGTGWTSELARRIAELLATYCEVSPSGTGVKLICRVGDIKPPRIKKTEIVHAGEKVEVETYTVGRFFTITGVITPESKSLDDRSVHYRRLVEKWFTGRSTATPPPGSTITAPTTPVAGTVDVWRIRAALTHLDHDDETTWFAQACSLKRWGSETNNAAAARLLWDEWSRRSAKYDSSEQDSTWERVKTDGIGVGTLFQNAKDKGWNPSEGITEHGQTVVTTAARTTIGSPAPTQTKSAEIPLRLGRDIERMPTEGVWIIDGIIPRVGLTMITSEPKACKTLMAIDLAVAMTHRARYWLGNRSVNHHGAVIYLSLDQDLKLTRQRVEFVGGSDHASIYYVDANDLPPMDQGGLAALELLAQRIKTSGTPLAAIIVDVWADLAPAQASRKNAYLADSDSLRLVVQLAARLDVAIIILHHTAKDGSVSGSQAMVGKATQSILMSVMPQQTRQSEGNMDLVKRIVATCRSRLGSPVDEFGFDLWAERRDDEGRKVLVYREGVSKAIAENTAGRIVASLLDCRTPESSLTVADISDLINERFSTIKTSHGAVKKALQRLAGEGALAKCGRGNYYLASDEVAAAVGAVPPPPWTAAEPLTWGQSVEHTQSPVPLSLTLISDSSINPLHGDKNGDMAGTKGQPLSGEGGAHGASQAVPADGSVPSLSPCLSPDIPMTFNGLHELGTKGTGCVREGAETLFPETVKAVAMMTPEDHGQMRTTEEFLAEWAAMIADCPMPQPKPAPPPEVKPESGARSEVLVEVEEDRPCLSYAPEFGRDAFMDWPISPENFGAGTGAVA